jgi:transcriptional regulator with XRE-family HTH domain
MADMLGTCQSTYAHLESGKSNISIQRLLRISEILGINIHLLFDQFTREHGEKDIRSSQLTAAAPVFGFEPEIKHVYDQLIFELRSEIAFLRSLVKQERSGP